MSNLQDILNSQNSTSAPASWRPPRVQPVVAVTTDLTGARVKASLDKVTFVIEDFNKRLDGMQVADGELVRDLGALKLMGVTTEGSLSKVTGNVEQLDKNLTGLGRRVDAVLTRVDSIAIHVESSIQAGRKAKQDTQASVQGLSARMDDFKASIREAIDSITSSNEKQFNAFLDKHEKHEKALLEKHANAMAERDTQVKALSLQIEKQEKALSDSETRSKTLSSQVETISSVLLRVEDLCLKIQSSQATQSEEQRKVAEDLHVHISEQSASAVADLQLGSSLFLLFDNLEEDLRDDFTIAKSDQEALQASMAALRTEFTTFARAAGLRSGSTATRRPALSLPQAGPPNLFSVLPATNSRVNTHATRSTSLRRPSASSSSAPPLHTRSSQPNSGHVSSSRRTSTQIRGAKKRVIEQSQSDSDDDDDAATTR